MTDMLTTIPSVGTVPTDLPQSITDGLNGVFIVLTLKDRCDNCGSRAHAQVVMPGAQVPLLLCGHHFNKGRSILEKTGAVWRLEDCQNHEAYNCPCPNKVQGNRDGGSA